MAIPASELAQIQADLAAAVCDKTCIIQRPVKTADGYGTKSESPTPNIIATTMAGMKQPDAGLLTNYAYRIESLAAWHVLLPYGTDVQENDLLIIDENTLRVHVLLDPHSVPGMTPVLAAELKP